MENIILLRGFIGKQQNLIILYGAGYWFETRWRNKYIHMYNLYTILTFDLKSLMIFNKMIIFWLYNNYSLVRTYVYR
jgi:hypothetical protein